MHSNQPMHTEITTASSRAFFAAPNRNSVGLREKCPARGTQNLTCDSLEMVKPRPVIVFQQVIPLDCEVQA